MWAKTECLQFVSYMSSPFKLSKENVTGLNLLCKINEFRVTQKNTEYLHEVNNFLLPQ